MVKLTGASPPAEEASSTEPSAERARHESRYPTPVSQQRPSLIPVSIHPDPQEWFELVEEATERLSEAPASSPSARLQEAVDLMVALHGVSMKMSTSADEKELLLRAVEGGLDSLHIDRMAIFLIDGDQMQGTWGTNEAGEVVNEWDFSAAIPDHPIVQRALVQKDFMAIDEEAPLYLRDRIVGTGWNAMISIWTGEAALGWIACDNLIHQRPLRPFQRQVLKLFGSAVAQMIARARAEANLRSLNRSLEARVHSRTEELASANSALEAANEELKRISHQDGLTRIANRRFFDESLERELARCRRHQRPLSLIMLDVDHFKSFNDALGHLAGDETLRRVALCLQKSARRAADLAARYGGEEFALLLPESDLEAAMKVAERTREAVKSLKVQHPGKSSLPVVTISLGVATIFPDESTKPQDIIQLADDALYSAKESGRDRCMSYKARSPS